MSPWDVRFDPDDAGHCDRTAEGGLRLTVVAEPALGDGRAVLRTAAGVRSVPLDRTDAGRFTYWTAVVDPIEAPIGLSLSFVDPSGRPVYVVPSGVSASVERLDRWNLEPDRPAVDVPDWAKGAVIYQIFPDRFENGDPDNDPPGAVTWESEPHARSFHGGDLVGVTRRLDHLVGLGADAIYLNPIFTSPSNHRYDTIDYHTVDPALGGDEALRGLVAAAHERGIRVILDASLNHVHPRFFAFRDLIERGPRSEYRDWFVVHDWPLRVRHNPSASAWSAEWLETWKDQTGLPVEQVSTGPAVSPTYDAWYGVPTMPRLNLANPETRAFALSVAEYWLRAFDVDGWRMDVARYVDPRFWPEFRTACRTAKADAYLLCEIMGDVSPWLQGDAFDATMNYTFRDLALGFFAREERDGGQLLDLATRLYSRHPQSVTLANHNLLGSHDTPRFRTEAGGERWRLQLATVFQLLYPGAPGLYYGDELGLEGGDDPGCRGSFRWELVGGSEDFTPTIASLVALRRRHAALRLGDWSPQQATRDAFVFRRSHGASEVWVAVNRGTSPARFTVEDPGSLVWGAGMAESGRITVDARSVAVFA